VQNPVASLISVPLQNFTDFNTGPFGRDRNTVLQFQPVIPIQLGENWNLITRTIGALVFQPNIAQAHQGTFGLNDINPSFFLSPAKAGKVIWGVGPTFLLPTATDDVLGTGKLSIGPGGNRKVVSFVRWERKRHWPYCASLPLTSSPHRRTARTSELIVRHDCPASLG
jgi:hypothetical protein